MDNDRKPLNSAPWWKPGVELFTEVSSWIVVPIVLALVIGKILDAHYGTKPTLFLISIAIAFFFTCVGMVKVVRKYLKKIREIEENNKEK